MKNNGYDTRENRKVGKEGMGEKCRDRRNKQVSND